MDYLVDRTIRGDFGNGEERKRNLGPLYGFVQNGVNSRLGYSKWHNPFDYFWRKMSKKFILNINLNKYELL